MMTRPSALGLALSAALVAAPATASAASLSTDTRCYQETQEVVLNGTGYAPLAQVNVLLGDQPLGTAAADANGSFQRKFSTPELPAGKREAIYTLSPPPLSYLVEGVVVRNA